MLDALRAAGRPDGEPFDVLVIGGGITGVGVALDAAARGLRTALVERDDFASGTSSKSSKMIHGGLRYLQNGDVRLVYEALRERRRLMRNAPHLVEVLPFMIPILTKDGVVSKKVAKALGSAMWMYDLTGGWRIGKLHKRVSGDEAGRHFPTTHLDKLSAGYLYYDAGADDARLTLTVARTAAQRGAVIVNRCGVVDITTDPDGRANGATVRADDELIHVPARCVVNAAGVWADEVRALDEGSDPHSIRPAKGVHVTIPWEKVRNDIAVIIPVRSDKRSLFLVPWGEQPDGTFRHVYVGTTDTDTDEPLDDPQCTSDDIDYVLTALNEALTETVTRDDITGVWAGMRPLVKSASAEGDSAKTADLSRRHQVAISESGVVRVNGGKLTTYREMAEDTVDVVVRQLDAPRRTRRSATRRLSLFGATRRSRDGRARTVEEVRRHTWHAGSGRRPTRSAPSSRSTRLSVNPSFPASPTCAPRPCTQHAMRWRPRSTTSSSAGPVPTCSIEPPRSPSPPTLPNCSPLNSAGTSPRPNARSPAIERCATPRTQRPERQAHPTAAHRLRSHRIRSHRRQSHQRSQEPTMTSSPTPPIELLGAGSRFEGPGVEVPEDALRALESICEVVTEGPGVAEASRDWWPLALHWALAGNVPQLADVVVRPASTDEVVRVTQVCNNARLPLTVAGGRSGVCGAAAPVFGGVVLDATALAGVVGIDEISGVVEVLPGTFGPDLEDVLRAAGLSVGHFPQSFDLATVGGWIGSRGAGQYSTRYGKIEDMVVGLEVVLADGTVVRTGGAPAAAAGPDLTQLFVGSEGTLGVITDVWLRTHPVPEHEQRAAYSFASFRDGVEACRQILRAGATPAVLRLYDAAESQRGQGGDGTECILLVLDEGDVCDRRCHHDDRRTQL